MFNMPGGRPGAFPNPFEQAPASPPAPAVAAPSDGLSLEAPRPFANSFEDTSFSLATGGPAIVLAGRDYQRFIYRFDMSLARAREAMSTIHREARMDRAVYRMLDREPEYEGAPAITTPISANKADGELAHIVDAIEQRPLFTFTADGFGEAAEEASTIAPIAEAYLEREINRGGSRELLVRGLARDAVQVGTGIAKLVMVQHPSGEWFAVPVDIFRLETAYFDRIYVPNLKHVMCAFEIRKPIYVLDEWAQEGLIDPQVLDEVKTTYGERFTPTVEEQEENFTEESASFQEENAVLKLYEGYMSFRSEGASGSHIYQVIWSDVFKKALAIRPNPVADAFDQPPIALVRVGKQPGYLLGRSVIRRLNPVQQIADNAINNHLAINNLAANPPFLYRKASPFGKALIDRRIVPGQGIAVTGANNSNDDVKLLQFPNPGLSLRDVEVAKSFADQATFTEESIGSSSTRKTLGQFRIEANRGTMRLRLDIGDLAYDMATVGTMLWAMMNAYKIRSQGVVEVGDGGKFLADHNISPEEVDQVRMRIVQAAFPNMVDPQEEQAVKEFWAVFDKKLTNGGIPSSRRGDLTISLKGTKVIADQSAELEMLREFTPYVTALLSAAQQNKFINYHLRSIAEAMGFKDVDKRVPPVKQAEPQTPEQYQQATAPFNNLMAHSSNMA